MPYGRGSGASSDEVIIVRQILSGGIRERRLAACAGEEDGERGYLRERMVGGRIGSGAVFSYR